MLLHSPAYKSVRFLAALSRFVLPHCGSPLPALLSTQQRITQVTTMEGNAHTCDRSDGESSIALHLRGAVWETFRETSAYKSQISVNLLPPKKKNCIDIFTESQTFISLKMTCNVLRRI